MYTRRYDLDHYKYPADISKIKSTVMSLPGVSDVEIADASHALIVHFDNPLSEKQILSAINIHKKQINRECN